MIQFTFAAGVTGIIQLTAPARFATNMSITGPGASLLTDAAECGAVTASFMSQPPDLRLSPA